MKRTIPAITLVSALTLTAGLAGAYAATSSGTVATSGPGTADSRSQGRAVDIKILSPRHGENTGIAGAGWFVDLSIEFRDTPLAQTGFTTNQLTGPAAHNSTAPFPGTFSTGKDDRMPGLVALISTTNSTLPGFSGPGTNLANLFNLTGVTDRSRGDVAIQDTWIVGAPIAGRDISTTLTVAVIDDLDQDGVYNDAPAVVTDQNADGRIDGHDLRILGVASKVETVNFRISGAPA